MANQWGNPELKSFKNNYVRRVMVDAARVFVHRLLVSEVEEILIRASSHGAVFTEDGLPQILPAYGMDDSIESKYGLKFQIPNFDTKIDISDLNFSQLGDVFIYTKFDSDVEITPPTKDAYIDEVVEKIGSRQLKLGSSGRDVKFIAHFLGMNEPSQREDFDKEMQDATVFFQERMGMPVNGEIDFYTWNAIIPKGSERIAAGYAGVKVRALQSALRVVGYNIPVTSRFGTETIKVVRQFQQDNELRVTGRVGLLEWNVLFHLR
jgi:hypothetical protein